ncbi:MAG: hypothetical protein HC800_09365 [Phormidesmis sp. RL_2_1]|nr:hypothetical protein [Phormidesmis sp. RL_2_1]
MIPKNHNCSCSKCSPSRAGQQLRYRTRNPLRSDSYFFDDALNGALNDALNEPLDWGDTFADDYAADEDWLTPPGNCTSARHSSLQKQVKALCDRGSLSRRCTPATKGCNRLSQRIKLNVLCGNARRKINEECYAGGNAGHIRAQNDAYKAAAACRKQWKEQSCQQQLRGRRNIPRFDGYDF